MTGLLLVLMTAAGDAPRLSLEEEGPRFETSELPPHFHGEFSLLGAGGLSSTPVGGAGVGLHVELGLVLEGTSILSVRLSGASVGYFTLFQGGFGFAERLNSRFTLGIGVTWGGMVDSVRDGGWLGFHLPVRATMQLGDDPRRGFIVGLELSPGLAHNGGTNRVRPPMPQLTAMGQLTIGYAVW